MAFSEKVKLEAKRRAAFRCCICQKVFVEVHHIIPQSEDGPDILENAAPLCASCHDLFGGNPEKRKQIREMRDYWWDLIKERNKQIIENADFGGLTLIDVAPESINELKGKVVAIYHNVFSSENFEQSAKILFSLIKEAQLKCPNLKRHLYLDIEGHVNTKGGFDSDMFELQNDYILKFLIPFLSEVYLPLGAVANTKRQRNDLPGQLVVLQKPAKKRGKHS